MATPGALANIPPDELIEQIYNGAVPAKLAADIGIHKCSIYRHLASHPEYQKARKIGMAVRLDDAELAVDGADERTLGIARERWRVVTWRAEREHPDTWGQRSTVVHEIGGELAEALARTRERVIEGTASVVPEDTALQQKPR